MRVDRKGIGRLIGLAGAFGLVVAGTMTSLPVTASAQEQIDINAILRCVDIDATLCSKGRELVLVHCTVCHTIAPIVLQQFDQNGWRGLLDRHHAYAKEVSEDEFATLEKYLAANFNESMDPPELPEVMLKAWTDY
jgi:mono/diheme cytochrome c family protein